MTDSRLIDVVLAPGTGRATVAPAHARGLCAGHFPDDPLVPGAYLAELMADLAAHVVERPGQAPAEVVRCVFLSPVRPPAPIELRAHVGAPDGLVDVEAWTPDRCVARGSFRFGGRA